MQTPPEEPSKLKFNIVRQLFTIALAVGLIWFSFRGANLSEIWQSAKDADVIYLAATCAVSLISHFVRAFRWRILLSPLSDHRISLYNCFKAVVFGYAVNLAIPRGGEIVRLFSLSRSENIPWVSVLPTLLIDRLLDVALLVFLLGGTLLILPASILKQMPWLPSGGVVLTVGTVLGLVALPRLSAIVSWSLSHKSAHTLLPENMKARLLHVFTQFDAGTKSLTNPGAYPAITAASVFLWFLYWLACYLSIQAFHLGHQVSLTNTTIVFTVSSVGVLVPTPGCVGSYHFLTSQALILSSGVAQSTALAMVTVTHLLVFALVPITSSLVCLAIDAIGRRQENRKTVSKI
jgi:glycosyltransferase 2 family protein